MPAQLTGYVCSFCGFIIIELKPVSPRCPVCTTWDFAGGRLEKVIDVGEVKFLAVKLHLREQAGNMDAGFDVYFGPRPVTD